MSRKLIVVLPVLPEALRERIRQAAEGRGLETLFFADEQEAQGALAEAEIILGQSPGLPGHAPRLRWLCTPSAGVDHLLSPALWASPEAVLTNSSGAYGVTIAEHIVMVTLEMMRRMEEYREITARRAWRRDLHIRAIRGSRVTLLGTGDIGREAAVRLRAFGPASLTGVNRSGRDPGGLFDRVLPQERLEELLPETDLLILSLPATAETAGILSRERLALLPEDAFLVNVGRGSAIDEAALEERLRAGRLGGAALDVFAREPLPRDSSLWTCPRLVLTPHVAGNMTLDYTVEKIVDLFLEDLARYCKGKPLLRTVDRSAGY